MICKNLLIMAQEKTMKIITDFQTQPKMVYNVMCG